MSLSINRKECMFVSSQEACRFDLLEGDGVTLHDVPTIAPPPRTGVGFNGLALVSDAVMAGLISFIVVRDDLLTIGVGAIVTVACVAVVVGYRPVSRMAVDYLRELIHFGFIATATAWAVLLTSQATGSDLPPLRATVLGLLLCGGLVARRAAQRSLATVGPERIVVLGSGIAARRVVELSRRHSERNFQVIGCLDDRPQAQTQGDPALLGGVGHLPLLLRRGQVDRVVVAFSAMTDTDLLEVVRRCDNFGVPVDVVPRFFELIGHEPAAYRIGGMPMVTIRGRRSSVMQEVLKRLFDLAVSLSVLALALVPLVVIAVAVKLGDRGPTLFRQRRIGRYGRSFSVFKFRTMVIEADAIGERRIAALQQGEMSVADAVQALKPEDDPRVTRVGRLLRATSLDELPQLFNVVRGEMSLVGPRPLRDFEVAALVDWQRDRQQLKPGLTGLWQTSGRSAVEWEERLHLDYLYVRHWSLAGDLRILYHTVPVLFGRRGAR
jgi:exopolysaccharide biosynthesis polyprenyl glycosylphosphotransferase